MSQYINLQGGSNPSTPSIRPIDNNNNDYIYFYNNNSNDIINTYTNSIYQNPAGYQQYQNPAGAQQVPSTPPQVQTSQQQVPITPPQVQTSQQQVPSTPPQVPSTPPQVPSTPPQVPSTPPQGPSTTPQGPSTTPQVQTSQQQGQNLASTWEWSSDGNLRPRYRELYRELSRQQTLQGHTRSNTSFLIPFDEMPVFNIQTSGPSVARRLDFETSRQSTPQTTTPIAQIQVTRSSDIVCEQTYYSYIKSLMIKKNNERRYISSSIKPIGDSTKLIQQLDMLFFGPTNLDQNQFIEGNFEIKIGDAVDVGGPYNEYLRLLSENLGSIFIIEENRTTGSKLLKFNPIFNFGDMTEFYAPILTLSNIIILLSIKNINIVTKLELGHIVKLLIIDNLEVIERNINLEKIPRYFLDIIIGYVKYCSKESHPISEDNIRAFLQNADCFKATVYYFVQFVHENFKPNLKIDLDYIRCFSNRLDFAFSDDIDWNLFLIEPAIAKLIKTVSEKVTLSSPPTVFKLYSMFYYNEIVKVEEFVAKLKFVGLAARDGNNTFLEQLKKKLIAICSNYASCLDPAKAETSETIETIGSQENFIKLLLSYMSGLNVIIPGEDYKFQLTSSQQDLLYSHTCFKTIDIVKTASDLSLHDLTSGIISRILDNTGFNRR